MPIRPTRFEDLDAIAEILVRGWQFAYRGIIPDEELDALDVVQRADAMRPTWRDDFAQLVWVDENDRAVGCCREWKPPKLETYDCEIGVMYVHPDHSRSGIGIALVSAMVEIFLARGGTSMCIETLRDNAISRPFYEKLGGDLCGEGTWRGYPTVWYGWPELQKDFKSRV